MADDKNHEMLDFLLESTDAERGEQVKDHMNDLRKKMAAAGVSTDNMGRAPEVPDCPPCDFCGKEFAGSLLCASCKCVSYCSRECQKSHWKQHKGECDTMDQECEEAAELFVDVVGDRNCPMSRRLSTPFWEALDGSSPYKKAIEKGLHRVLQDIFVEEVETAKERIASGVLASYTQTIMCTLFRNGRHIPGYVFSGLDAYRIKKYVHSDDKAFDDWFQASLKIISIFAVTGTTGSNTYFWTLQKIARDITAGWSMVFTSNKAAKAILLGTSKQVDDAAKARVKWICGQLEKALPLFPEESPDNSAVEGQLNQFTAMIDLRCEEFGIEVDFVQLLGLRGRPRDMYNNIAIPYAGATIQKGRTLTTAESGQALRAYVESPAGRRRANAAAAVGSAGNKGKKKGKKNRRR